jgi:hypothetical protein
MLDDAGPAAESAVLSPLAAPDPVLAAYVANTGSPPGDDLVPGF